MLELQLLALLIAANGAPVLGLYLLGERGAAPIDGGRQLADGRPLLGPSKTWRGLALALLAGALLAALLGLPPAVGLALAAAAMAGDLLTSFAKRRAGLAPSARLLLLDHIPESLLPLALGRSLLDYGWGTALAVCAAFAALSSICSPLLQRWSVRRRPY